MKIVTGVRGDNKNYKQTDKSLYHAFKFILLFHELFNKDPAKSISTVYYT